MNWYHWFALVALAICLGSLLIHLIKIIKLGNPQDFSNPLGKPAGAMSYAFVGAMSPAKKESAYLHMPTYTAGIIYHLGTFLSIFLFFLIFGGIILNGWLLYSIAGFLVLSALSGFGILIKRMVRKKCGSYPILTITSPMLLYLYSTW